MWDLRFFKIISILIVLAGAIGFSFAANIENVIIHNTGRIISEIIAKSGYWRDIQEAVNLAASSGIGIVYIPEGTWNFVNPGESWTGARVVIPAGVSVFGAPTEKYENGSVKEWKTILVVPWDFPGDRSWNPPVMFLLQGNSDPNKASRISDIKFIGPRDWNDSATGVFRAIRIEGVVNFRIDHCCIEDIGEGIAISIASTYESCGVIDHCIFDNENGWHGGTTWENRTVGYGIVVYRHGYPFSSEWPLIQDVLGKYLNYTIFIENCVFTKWRSCVVGNYGAHYVVRNCTFIHGFGFGEVDLHPSFSEGAVHCRAVECYNNRFIDPVGSPPGYPTFAKWAVSLSAGSGVFFNNTLSGYDEFLHTINTYPEDVYVWQNELSGAALETGPCEEGVNYFLYKPDWYTPYLYPHPLITD